MELGLVLKCTVGADYCGKIKLTDANDSIDNL